MLDDLIDLVIRLSPLSPVIAAIVIMLSVVGGVIYRSGGMDTQALRRRDDFDQLRDDVDALQARVADAASHADVEAIRREVADMRTDLRVTKANVDGGLKLTLAKIEALADVILRVDRTVVRLEEWALKRGEER